MQFVLEVARDSSDRQTTTSKQHCKGCKRPCIEAIGRLWDGFLARGRCWSKITCRDGCEMDSLLRAGSHAPLAAAAFLCLSGTGMFVPERAANSENAVGTSGSTVATSDAPPSINANTGLGMTA